MERKFCFRCKGNGSESYGSRCLVCEGSGYSVKVEAQSLKPGQMFRYNDEMFLVVETDLWDKNDRVLVVHLASGKVNTMYPGLIVEPWINGYADKPVYV